MTYVCPALGQIWPRHLKDTNVQINMLLPSGNPRAFTCIVTEDITWDRVISLWQSNFWESVGLILQTRDVTRGAFMTKFQTSLANIRKRIFTLPVFSVAMNIRKTFDIHFSMKPFRDMSRLLFWIPPCCVFKNGYTLVYLKAVATVQGSGYSF